MTTGRINQVCQVLPRHTQPHGNPWVCMAQQQKCDGSHLTTAALVISAAQQEELTTWR